MLEFYQKVRSSSALHPRATRCRHAAGQQLLAGCVHLAGTGAFQGSPANIVGAPSSILITSFTAAAARLPNALLAR